MDDDALLRVQSDKVDKSRTRARMASFLRRHRWKIGATVVVAVVVTAVVVPVLLNIAAEINAAKVESYFPIFHMHPPSDYMNDPYGFIFYDNLYHMFYQYVPGSPFDGPKSWYHATSPDLTFWTQNGVVLNPQNNTPDSGGCWDGRVITNGTDGVLAVFTGVVDLPPNPVFPWKQSQLLMRARDSSLQSWEVFPTPVMASPPDNYTAFRDPFVFERDGKWHCLIGSGYQNASYLFPEGGAPATILRYTSLDLVSWTFEGVFYQTNDIAIDGHNYETPGIYFTDDNTAIVTVGVNEFVQARWYIGTWSEAAPFAVSSTGLLDFGTYYAASGLTTPAGSHMLWGWAEEQQSAARIAKQGWAGVLTVPRQIVPQGNSLLLLPFDGLIALRGTSKRLLGTPLILDDDITVTLPGFSSAAADVLVSFSILSAINSVMVFYSDAENTRISFLRDQKLICVYRNESSVSPGTFTTPQCGPFTLQSPDFLNLRILVDHSVIEVYANNVFCLTARVYPSLLRSSGVAVRCQGGTATVDSLVAYKMTSMFSDPATPAPPPS